MKASGVSQDLIDEVGDAIGGWPADKEDIKQGMELIPDDVVHKLTASGTPEQCREKSANTLRAAASARFSIRSGTTAN